ncbi:efflux transporter outer membrane subunit [Pedosphaera parvula]|uniref:RND efflux system, outer membrane lipoprotein, NodT family n=1 Tax=Pedosphaera parvula (strain Ellin514) TaxID=320771 RepID=B9XB32_PEDPL|nr:efflux transporter outer membrane subunit [Pedosphaera parvula]EEF62717.1 RND efflux system, outer membrane lipoprotein, NodT family [Pedosphaera parvula Ellin514]
MRKSVLYVLAASMGLVGCTMIPKYERPTAPVSTNWPSGPAYVKGASTSGLDAKAGKGVATADIGWRDFFSDPRLQQLIQLSLTNNLDLRIAALNVEQTQAQYRIQRSELFPTIDAGAGFTRARTPAAFSFNGRAITASQYTANLSTTAYELDLFGRVRSLSRQALEQYFATEEARQSVQISLVAQVAIQYLTERELDEQLVVSRQTLDAVQSSYELNRRSFEAGVASELDLRSAEAQVGSAKANVAAYMRLRAQAVNTLEVLVGQPIPADLPEGRALDAQNFANDLPEGLPSDLLQRRPDIVQAEYQLRAANANIGAARAAFFPRVTLTGAAGGASLQLTDLFKGPAAAWSFSPQITVPIFTGGRNKAELDVAKITKRIEVAQYQRSIQNGFREVADALTARAMLEDQIQAQETQVKAEQQRYLLADRRYRQGVDSYLTVLTAQQDLYSAQQSLLQSRLARFSNFITLYKALGGGWLERTAVARK